MSNSDQKLDEPRGRTWQPRFGLFAIFLVVFVCCVMAAGGNYLVQALRGGRVSQLSFILFTVASPLLLVVLVSLGMFLMRWFNDGPRR